MRTTITLDEQLLRAAKRIAAQRGVTLSEVVCDALRAHLVAKPVRSAKPFKLVTFKGGGAHPGIDLDRASSLEELDDVERYGGRARP